MEIQCIVVDDEPPARDELVYILSHIPEVRVVASAGSASGAVEAIKEHGPDLVFLDIKMPGESGFDVAEKISRFDRPPLVVFATAYDQYAVKAFEASAIDYILKPYTRKRVVKSIDRAGEMLSGPSAGDTAHENLRDLIARIGQPEPKIVRVPVERKGRILLLDPDEIIFFQSEDKKITAHTCDRSYLCHGDPTLDRLEENLSGLSFYRTHRSTLVNLMYVKEVSSWFHGRYLLVMNDAGASEISVSRTRVKSLKTKLGFQGTDKK